MPRELAWEPRPNPIAGDAVTLPIGGEALDGAVALALPGHLAATFPGLNEGTLFGGYLDTLTAASAPR